MFEPRALTISLCLTHIICCFFAAAIVLTVTPGTGIFYVLARSLAGGKREGLLSSLGTFLVFAAALGLSAILAASAAAFHTVKYAGAEYLVWLGIRMIRTRNAEMTVETAGPSDRAFRQGILTEVLNPRTALFFLSFIPQFVAPTRGDVFVPFAVLGCVSVTLNTALDLLVVAMASPLERKWKNSVRFRRRSTRPRHDWPWGLPGPRGLEVAAASAAPCFRVQSAVRL